MNVLAVITFILVEVFFVSFIILILQGGLRNPVNRSFFFFLVIFALWAASNLLSNITTLSHDMILYLNRSLFVVSVIGLYSLLIFITRIAYKKVKTSTSLVTAGITVVGIAFAISPLTVADVFVDASSSIGVKFGSLAFIYFLVVVCISGVILYRLAVGTRQSSPHERSKAKVLFLSIGVAIATILATNVLVPLAFGNFGFTVVGLFAGMFIIAGVSYGIVRHGMFDIKRAAVRSVTYSLLLVTLAVCYFVLAFLISNVFGNVFMDVGQAVSGVVISLALALIFQPLRQFFDKATNKFFYKNEYISDDFFAALNRTLVSTTDLKSLLQRASSLVSMTLKSEQAFFFIHTDENHYISAGTKNYAKLPFADANDLENYSDSHSGILQVSLIQDNHIRRLLLSHRIELVMPLVQGKEIIGLLCLGEHMNAVYSRRDLRVLETVSDELTIAIQNALSIDEVKDLNAHLEQRIESATKELRVSNAQLQRLDEAKDEFISMASHQLRTPLTSIKGYISMLMDGDVGKVSKEQQHLLEEVFLSSERMVRLIGDFLNVSRLQTGKFTVEKHLSDLAQIVAEEVESLEPNASAHGLKFVYKHAKNIPRLALDENKIQQVIMNFCDNAIYYSKEKNSKINVSLMMTDEHVEFKVKDTGIGIPVAEQEQLFNKFFRATNARKQRPDGTGVGLFLAKKVIDAHDGEIIFESKEGKGSTFGFRLPLPKS